MSGISSLCGAEGILEPGGCGKDQESGFLRAILCWHKSEDPENVPLACHHPKLRELGKRVLL